MADRDEENPEDAFRDMLRELLGGIGGHGLGGQGIDPQQLANAAGLPGDAASIQQLMSQLQGALVQSGDGINWGLSRDRGLAIAAEGAVSTTPAESSALDQAFHVAALWLDEATAIASLPETPALLSRAQWVAKTMPLWTQLAEPVASSIADALTTVLRDEAPEEARGMLQNAGQLVRAVGGTLFAMQLGQVVGQLSAEVVSGGDIGIPLLGDGEAALLPQNVAAFGEGLDIPADQVPLYLAVRELAHARLFRHARWLRLQVVTAITEFAHGISIDTSRLQDLAESFDPANPESLRDALASGALIPPKSDVQEAALARLETMLALIEGWVDVVTAQATARLPKSDAIAETVRRRRASGGPAESAFQTLVGLELRPRRLREATAMWQAVTDAVGSAERDALWGHPDLLPSSEDIDDPGRLVERLRESHGAPTLDDIDLAIEELLGDDSGERPTEA